ncbi:Voltage-dependent calcium channel type A subunit alpha-1 [Durusdinium trenchii]|uniref:Voltage-dependent calcium channel type A subunit alpha-1 n=1 Tax=Durusdinium trenchii TaxID=1381693 RepID=A0ABP0QNA5_9DINO
MDVDLSRLDKQRQAMHGWISSSFFDSFIGFIILINAVIIGFEAEVSTQIPFGCDESCQCGDAGRQSECFAMPEWLQAVDYVFAGIYIAEFGLSNWVKFDLFLILSSMLDIALKQVVRILRLARLARAVLHGCADLDEEDLVQVETIHVDLTLPLEHPYNVAVMQNFDRFSDAMLTLFQCFTLDSAGEVYRPLITHNPVLIAYFMTVILVMAVSLMNLVTAIMVNSALDQASEDKDVKRAYEAVQKRKQPLDSNMEMMKVQAQMTFKGELTLEELKTAPEEVREQLEAVAGTEDIEGLFQMLDYDGGGSLDTSEFCEGVLKASTSEKPLELTRLVKQCSDILRLCHLVPSCKRKTRLPCFLPFRPMRAFPFAPLSHRPEHVCEPEAEDSRSVSQGILEFQLRGRSWERIWAKPSANAGLHFGIIDLFIYIYIYHFFQRLCR